MWARGILKFSIELPYNNSLVPTIQTKSIKGSQKMNQLAEFQCHREGFMEKIKCELRGHRMQMHSVIRARGHFLSECFLSRARSTKVTGMVLPKY